MGLGWTGASAAQRTKWIWICVVWVTAFVAIMPVLFHLQAKPAFHDDDSRLWLRLAEAHLVTAGICFWIYRIERGRLRRVQAIGLTYLLFLLACAVNRTHWFLVDNTSNYFVTVSNNNWQIRLHAGVLGLRPEYLPHCYRFLSDSIVRWFEIARLNFWTARDFFRMYSMLVLFYALYRYARLYASYAAAVLAVSLIAVIYPISFEYYAGQLVDPLSHLSFVIGLICLEVGDFAFFFTALMIGCLAKESVLCLVGYYLLFRWREKGYLWKSAALLLGTVLMYAGLRWLVLGGAVHYDTVSGTTPKFIWKNLLDQTWPPMIGLTLAAFVPFLILGWRSTTLSLKRQVLFLVPVLLLSSLLFSWLRESRNYMPVVFVLAVVAANYFMGLGPNSRARDKVQEGSTTFERPSEVSA